MASDWKTFTLEELASDQKSALATGPFGSAISSKFFQECGIPVIRGGNLSANTSKRMSDDGLVFVSEEKATEFKRSVVRKGDLIFTCWGTINQVGLLDEQRNYDEYIISNKQMKVTLDVDKADPLFVYYMFSGPKKQKEILQNGIGAAVPGFNLGQLREHKLTLPSIDKQRKIGSYLDSLDQKITLNNQVNQTLEQMAQTLFKSWFVDFDPVKAKISGQQPKGMDAATASLFPVKLVESELGLIPEGWVVNSLSELIKLTGGGTPKRSEETYWNGDIPWFSVRDAPSGSNVFVVDTDEKITKLGLNKSSTKLLPKGTTIITARGTVGKLALVGTDMCMNQSCYGIRGKDVGDYFNYFNLKEAVSTLQRNTHGAVFDTITTKTFDTYSLAFSGAELTNKFDDLIAPIFQKIESNVLQNIELAALRDTLLPKLLSSEVEL